LVHFDSVRISTAPRLSRHVTRSHARSIRMIWTVCTAVWELLLYVNSIKVMYTSIFYCMKHEELYILSVRPSSFFWY
jgi:hypothetical protein